MSLCLTAGDARRLGAAADALLSPPATADAALWWRDAERQLRALFPGASALLHWSDRGGSRLLSESVDAAGGRRLAELAQRDSRSGRLVVQCAAADAWVRHSRAHRVKVWGTAQAFEAIAAMGHDGPRSTFYNEGLAAAGLGEYVGLTSELPVGDAFVTLGYDRRGRSARGHLDDMELLGLLLPAFRAGHHALSRVDAQREAVAALVDRAPDALLVVAPDGRVVHQSAALGRLLAQEPERERVRAALLDAARALGADGRGRVASVPVARRGAVRAIVTPFARYVARATHAPEPLWGVAGAVAVALEPAPTGVTPPPDDGAASATHGLTPREAEVARLLARRATDAEVAAALGVSWHTARRHAERVLAKLGVRSRGQVASALVNTTVG